jgi:hypothetical protein
MEAAALDAAQERLKAGRNDGKTAYVVLERVTRIEPANGKEESARTQEVWLEIGTVELPKRSRSSSAVATVLDKLGREASEGGAFRVIPADDPVFTLREKPLPPVEERFEVVTV